MGLLGSSARRAAATVVLDHKVPDKMAAVGTTMDDAALSILGVDKLELRGLVQRNWALP